MGSLSKNAQQALNGYRAEIDAIDRQMIALLKERINIVSKVGELKSGDGNLQCYIRSGREADMLRQIYAEFAESNFHPLAACAIWRQIISASTQHEQPMKLLLSETGGASLKHQAQAYFGEVLEVVSFTTLSEATDLLDTSPASLLILPEPKKAPELWAAFAESKPEKLHLFAQIPFIRKDESPPPAYVAANLLPEASTEDISLFAIRKQDGWHYQTLEGYITKWPEERVALPEETDHIIWLGTYGVPLEMKRKTA